MKKTGEGQINSTRGKGKQKEQTEITHQKKKKKNAVERHKTRREKSFFVQVKPK